MPGASFLPFIRADDETKPNAPLSGETCNPTTQDQQVYLAWLRCTASYHDPEAWVVPLEQIAHQSDTKASPVGSTSVIPLRLATRLVLRGESLARVRVV